MRILILEDSSEKYHRIIHILNEEERGNLDIVRAEDVADARALMSREHFSLLVLDVQVPMRKGEAPNSEGGIYLLKEVLIDDACKRPSYVVGLTGVPEAYNGHSSLFQRQGWALLEYSASSTEWVQSLKGFVRHIRRAAAAESTAVEADVVILTALGDPEFSAVRQVFSELRGPQPLDERTLVWSGEVRIGEKTLRVVAGFSWQMGLTAAGILAERFIARYRPKILAMTGICAGRRDKVGLGDVVVANQSWEWQGGKIAVADGNSELLAAPEACRAAPDLLMSVRNLLTKQTWQAQLNETHAHPSDRAAWKVHIGPMLSGLSVVASADVMQSLVRQHRGVLALEMEAYAIYAAATYAPKECRALVMKGVCDFGDAGKEDSVQQIAALRSAMLLRAVLEEHAANFG